MRCYASNYLIIITAVLLFTPPSVVESTPYKSTHGLVLKYISVYCLLKLAPQFKYSSCDRHVAIVVGFKGGVIVFTSQRTAPVNICLSSLSTKKLII